MYKISSSLPLIWRTPTSVQIGVDHPRAVLPKLFPAEERFLSALRTGFADASLNTVAEECGLTVQERDAFLAAISPALEQEKPRLSWRIALDGHGPLVDSLGLLLIACGHRVVRATAHTAGKCDLALVVGDYVLDPHRPAGWLSRDIPHLPIVFSDETVRVGPLLGSTQTRASLPQDFPCEQCIELAHRDQDDCWIAMASQLIGTPAPAQAPLLNAEIAAVVTRWIEDPYAHPISSNTALEISNRNGAREVITFYLHPDCACQALPRNVSVLGSSLGQFPVQPTRVKAAS